MLRISNLIKAIAFYNTTKTEKKKVPDFRLFEINEGSHKNLLDITNTDERLLIFFLPGLWAPWCREVLFRIIDQHDYLRSVNILPVAVISQDHKNLQKYDFIDSVKFPIFADAKGFVSKRYGAFDDYHSEPMKISKPSFFITNCDLTIDTSFIGTHVRNIPSFIGLTRMT